MPGHIAESSSVDWLTPDYILDAVRKVLADIDLDPCSNEWSRVGAKLSYRLPVTDGLKASWDYHTVFVNPPFGRCYLSPDLETCLTTKQYRALKDEFPEEAATYTSSTVADWIRRCAQTRAECKNEIVAIVPAAVDTKVWHETIFKTATSICFPEGRVVYVDPESGAAGESPPMASTIVYWGENPIHFREAFQTLGFVFRPTA